MLSGTFPSIFNLSYYTMPRYTTEDLILYLYQETSEEQTEAMKEALETDWDLKEEMDDLKHTVGALDEMVKSPRQQSVDAILKYAGFSTTIEHP